MTELTLPELHAAACSEILDPGAKISPAVGLTSETLGASTFDELDPGTTVHGAAVVVPVGEGDALAVAVAVPVLLTVAVGLGVAVPPVLLLHATPFSVNAVGVSSAPLKLNVAPIPVDAFVARLPFQLSLATLTDFPLCVHVPSHPLANVSEPAYEYCKFQLEIAGPSLLMVICTSNPLPQFELTLY